MFDQFKSLFILLALTSGLAVAGCGGGDAPPADAPDAAPAADAAPADAAPADAAADAAPADADTIAAGIQGEWVIALGAEDKAKLDEARKTLEANPEDMAAKMLVGMMDGRLASMTLTVADGTMTMGAGDQVKTIAYTVSDKTDAGLTLTTKEEGAETEDTIKVAMTDGGMSWTKAGEEAPMLWAPKPPPAPE